MKCLDVAQVKYALILCFTNFLSFADDEAPILNCPNISSTTDTGFNVSSSVVLNSTATDNVDTNVSVDCIPSSNEDFLVGDTTVNCTSTDTAGNTGSCSLIVTVIGTKALFRNLILVYRCSFILGCLCFSVWIHVDIAR